jgi:hypothetical protein
VLAPLISPSGDGRALADLAGQVRQRALDLAVVGLPPGGFEPVNLAPGSECLQATSRQLQNE